MFRSTPSTRTRPVRRAVTRSYVQQASVSGNRLITALVIDIFRVDVGEYHLQHQLQFLDIMRVESLHQVVLDIRSPWQSFGERRLAFLGQRDAHRPRIGGRAPATDKT